MKIATFCLVRTTVPELYATEQSLELAVVLVNPGIFIRVLNREEGVSQTVVLEYNFWSGGGIVVGTGNAPIVGRCIIVRNGVGVGVGVSFRGTVMVGRANTRVWGVLVVYRGFVQEGKAIRVSESLCMGCAGTEK